MVSRNSEKEQKSALAENNSHSMGEEIIFKSGSEIIAYFRTSEVRAWCSILTQIMALILEIFVSVNGRPIRLRPIPPVDGGQSTPALRVPNSQLFDGSVPR